MRSARLAVTVPFLAAALVAQAPAPPDVALHKAEVAKLSWMVGTWEGDGWSQRGEVKSEFRQSEKIALKLDGQTLELEGEGHSKADASKVVFRALGVVFYDPYAKGVRLASWTDQGYWAVSPMTVTAKGYSWTIDLPNNKTRYTATLSGGKWSEIGEWSADGKSWAKFFEMNLTKKS